MTDNNICPVCICKQHKDFEMIRFSEINPEENRANLKEFYAEVKVCSVCGLEYGYDNKIKKEVKREADDGKS